MASLLAACVVSSLRPDAGTVGVTAIEKQAVQGGVKVTQFGLRGDVQADRKNDGGLDKALYVYSQADADYWQAQLGRDLPPGWFGDNLRVEGIDVDNARVVRTGSVRARDDIVVAYRPETPDTVLSMYRAVAG